MITKKSISAKVVKLSRRQIFDYGVLAVLIGLAFYICFFQLGASYFENWDEAWYAQMTREMMRSKDWITLRWDYQVYFDKAPLNIWLNAFWASIIGLSELSVRLTSALSGLTVILLVLIISYRLWGLLPSLFAYSAVALNNIFIWRTRTGNLDALLSLLIFLVYLFIISRQRFRYIFLGILFGLIYLQKSTVVLYPFIIFIIYELLDYRNLKKNLVNYLVLTAITVVIAGSWLWLGKLKAGEEFLHYYLFRADQGVSQISRSYWKKDYLDYTYYSLQRRLFYPFIIGVLLLLIKIRDKKNLVLLYFATALIILLSFTQRKNNWYLVPAMPFWALVVGYAVSELLQLANRFRIKNVLAIFLVIPLFYVSYKTLTVNIASIINTRASVAEVRSALLVKKLSKPSDIILRFDHLYPTTIYYAERKTLFHTTFDEGLYDVIDRNEIRWIIGKNDMAEEFIKKNNRYQLKRFNSGEETILQIIDTI